MIKAIQIAIANRVDDLLNVHLQHDEFRESMNKRIVELYAKINAALPDDSQELIGELDTLHTELETYCTHKVYQAGLSDGLQIGGNTI